MEQVRDMNTASETWKDKLQRQRQRKQQSTASSISAEVGWIMMKEMISLLTSPFAAILGRSGQNITDSRSISWFGTRIHQGVLVGVQRWCGNCYYAAFGKQSATQTCRDGSLISRVSVLNIVCIRCLTCTCDIAFQGTQSINRIQQRKASWKADATFSTMMNLIFYQTMSRWI